MAEILGTNSFIEDQKVSELRTYLGRDLDLLGDVSHPEIPLKLATILYELTSLKFVGDGCV